MVRLAFTLIELIFAIVIIGITVISLPMMTQVTSKGIDESIVQEAIFAAATELNEATTHHWDENSFDVGAENIYSRVITTALGTPTACNTVTHRRPGHINQELHRRCTDANSTVSNANTNGLVSSLDDLEHMAAGYEIFNESKAEAEGYKKIYTSTLEVTPSASFGNLANHADIKKIEITVSDDDGTVTKLTTYSFNIGEIDYHEGTLF